ncbi:MAG: hypothetical protein ABJA67_17185 [Chthonomonadales bacterium]
MKTGQIVILVIAAIVAVFELLFPPFVSCVGDSCRSHYDFVLNSTQTRQPADVNFDFVTLVLQLVLVGSTAAALTFTLKPGFQRRHASQIIAGFMFLSCAILPFSLISILVNRGPAVFVGLAHVFISMAIVVGVIFERILQDRNQRRYQSPMSKSDESGSA